MNNKEEIRELPWYVGDPKPTPQIIEKIVARFPSYALNRPEISCYYATFYKCRDIVKDYFTERANQAKSSKMQHITEEAWKLVGQFVGLFEMGENQDLSHWNVLNDKWDTVIKRFKQREKPAEPEQKTTPAKLRRTWTCVKEIPHWIYYLVGFLAALLTCIYLLWWLWTKLWPK